MVGIVLLFGSNIYYMEVFCTKLKELREEKQLSCKQLGKILGVSDASISRWENGKRLPTIDVLYNIAIYFNVSADYLIGLEM